MGGDDPIRERGSPVWESSHGKVKGRSDIDLAITVGEPALCPGTVRGHYFALGQRWHDELTTLLGKEAHIALYNDPDCDRVRGACEKCSVLLFP